MGAYVLIVTAYLFYVPHHLLLQGRIGDVPFFNIGNLFLVMFLGILLLSPATGKWGATREFRLRFWFAGLFLLFLISMMRALGNAYSLFDDLTEFKRIAAGLVVFFVVYLARGKERKISFLYLALLASISMVGLEVLRDGVLGGPSYGLHKRGSGPFGEGFIGSDVAGAYLAQFIALLLAGILWGTGLVFRGACTAGALVATLGMFSTYSRGALVALVGVVCVLLWLRFRWAVAMALPVVLVAGFALAPESIKSRVLSTASTEQVELGGEVELDAAVEGRFDYWMAALKLIGNNPLLGVGFNRGKYQIGQELGLESGVDPHNGYLMVALEMGIPALFLFVATVVALLLIARKTFAASATPLERMISGGAIGCLTAFILVNMVYANVFRVNVLPVFVATMGLLLAVRDWQRARAARSPIPPHGGAP